MKKLFVLSLAVCLFIFLCFPVLAAQFSDYPGATDVHFPESGDVVSFGYDDEVLFEEAVEVMNVPDNLVMPDDLQPIGEFFAIIEDTDWRVDGQFRQYTYLLHPHNEEGILCLEVDHVNANRFQKERPVLDISCVSENMSRLDMSKLDSSLSDETSFVIYRDGIEFIYLHEKLSVVCWRIGEVVFDITLSYNYQMEITDYVEGSFMNALLSLDEEKFAYARDILLSLGMEQHDNPGTGDESALWLVWMPLSLVGMAAVLSVRKRIICL